MTLPLYIHDPVVLAKIEADIAADTVRVNAMWTAELSLMGKIALLRMNNAKLSRRVAFQLIDTETFGAYPCYADYLELAKLGLCEKRGESQLHDITLVGSSRAESITRSECKRLGIHEVQGGALVGQGNCRYSCTCGGWSWTGRAGRYTQSNYGRSFNNHVTTANGMAALAAGLKPPVMVEG